MLSAFYQSGRFGGQVVVLGDVRGFKELIQFFGNDVSIDASLSLQEPQVTAADGHALQRFRVVRREAQNLRFSMEGTDLMCACGKEHIPILNKILSDLVENPVPGIHVHVEYYNGHFFLDPESVAMVLQIAKS